MAPRDRPASRCVVFVLPGPPYQPPETRTYTSSTHTINSLMRDMPNRIYVISDDDKEFWFLNWDPYAKSNVLVGWFF